MTNPISAVIVVSERHDPVKPLFSKYKDALGSLSGPVQIVYVLDGQFPEVRGQLDELIESGEEITIVELGRWYGEATALTLALPSTRGEIIVTLPAYEQVDVANVNQLVDALGEYDFVQAVRHPRKGSGWNRLQSRVFHGITNWISGSRFRDLGCGVRVLRRTVFDEVPLYGDLHRFLPMLAERAGLKVCEIEMTQAESDYRRRVYHPGIYIRRLLDMITVFFLVKFTKKPLRFFGLVGGAFAAIGGLAISWMVVERLLFDTALGGRPALMLGSLVFALGVQIICVGLIGELIIFTHALNIKEYSIEKIAGQDEIDS